ncbi:MAG: OmpH family outer membrane protein [Alistipes sp.]|nr:OmpH family outer membrane protein [Alistipes sp.]
MKRLIILAAFVLTAAAAAAQNYVVVNSEKVFKSVDAYNRAIAQLDRLAEQYQQEVDDRFAEVEQAYNTYMTQKASLTASVRQARENAILKLEQEATEYQESIFGQEGTLMKKRIELIEPIQKQVFAAIEAYARQIGAAAVIDSSNNPALLYTAPAADHTQQVIDALKK